MRYLKSTHGLRVTGLGDSIFIVWIPNYYGLFTPRLRYRHELNGQLELVKVQGQLKAIGINTSIMCSVLLLASYLDTGIIDIKNIYPILLGILGFTIGLNFLMIRVIKWKVEKQKQRHDNKQHSQTAG